MSLCLCECLFLIIHSVFSCFFFTFVGTLSFHLPCCYSLVFFLSKVNGGTSHTENIGTSHTENGGVSPTEKGHSV